MLVEVNCESDFVARTDDFKELVHDIAMHIAASDPKFVRKEDVTPETWRARRTSIAPKPSPAASRRRCGENGRGQNGQVLRGGLPVRAALHQGPDPDILQLISTKIGKLGENISVKRFARFKVGDAGETIAISKPEEKPE